MKNLSFILLALTMLLGATNSFAQQEEKVKLFSNEEFFSKSDYIIEGRGAGYGYAYSYDINGNYDRNDIYMSSLFIVDYVYKNNSDMRILRGDTLRLIRKGGTIYRELEDNPLDMERISSNGFIPDRLFADGPMVYFSQKTPCLKVLL